MVAHVSNYSTWEAGQEDQELKALHNAYTYTYALHNGLEKYPVSTPAPPKPTHH